MTSKKWQEIETTGSGSIWVKVHESGARLECIGGFKGIELHAHIVNISGINDYARQIENLTISLSGGSPNIY